MKAIRISSDSGPSGLVLDDVPSPPLGPTDLRVRVVAAGLNRADLLQSFGKYPAPEGAPPDIPGLEYAGEVIEVGPATRRFVVGTKVMGLVGGGALAEEIVTSEREALALPPGLSFEQGAAIPEAFFTAYDALHRQGGLRISEHVLIHAVTSGVGTAGAQLARVFGAKVAGTSRSKEKLSRVAQWVDCAIPVQGDPPRFSAEVLEASSGHGADLVLDLVGGSYLEETLAALAPKGRVLLVGTLAGRTAQLPLGRMLAKRATLIGTVLRSRPPEEKMALARDFETHICPLFAEGKLSPVVDSVLPMSSAREALERMARNETLGKLVLAWR